MELSDNSGVKKLEMLLLLLLFNSGVLGELSIVVGVNSACERARQKQFTEGVDFHTGQTLTNALGMNIPATWQSKGANNHVTMVKIMNVVIGVSKATYVYGMTYNVITKLFYDFVN